MKKFWKREIIDKRDFLFKLWIFIKRIVSFICEEIVFIIFEMDTVNFFKKTAFLKSHFQMLTKFICWPLSSIHGNLKTWKKLYPVLPFMSQKVVTLFFYFCYLIYQIVIINELCLYFDIVLFLTVDRHHFVQTTPPEPCSKVLHMLPPSEYRMIDIKTNDQISWPIGLYSQTRHHEILFYFPRACSLL